MTATQERFFALVRAGLWGTEIDTALFTTDTDWEDLYRQARAQALLGIVFDGIRQLPVECRPPRMLYLKWCNTLMQIEEKNQLLNRELANVYALCRENGIEPVLLKGQGVAQNYRNPLHRQCGDIDLYIGEANYERVNQLLRLESTHEYEENFKHTSLTWHGITIENHRVLINLSAPCADRRFQAAVKRWHSANEMRRLQVGDCVASLPPLEFDAVYILFHSVFHILIEGVGARQVCDWACLLHHNRETLDKSAVRRFLHDLGLEKAARVFGAFLVKYLGLPADCLPLSYLPEDEKTAEWLLEDIWKSGNFGHYNAGKEQRPKGYISSKWYTLKQSMSRCNEMNRLAPAEARWYPVVLTLHAIHTQWNHRVGKYFNR